MSYGFRLNLEQFYFEEALKHLKRSRHINRALFCEKTPIFNFAALKQLIKFKYLEHKDDQGNEMLRETMLMGSIAKSLIFHNFCFEAYIYLLYRYSVGKYNGATTREDSVYTEISSKKSWKKTYNKACSNIDWEEGKHLKSFETFSEMQKRRSELVHYKDGVLWRGFSYKTDLEEILTIEFLEKCHKSLVEFRKILGLFEPDFFKQLYL